LGLQAENETKHKKKKPKKKNNNQTKKKRRRKKKKTPSPPRRKHTIKLTRQRMRVQRTPKLLMRWNLNSFPHQNLPKKKTVCATTLFAEKNQKKKTMELFGQRVLPRRGGGGTLSVTGKSESHAERITYIQSR